MHRQIPMMPLRAVRPGSALDSVMMLTDAEVRLLARLGSSTVYEAAGRTGLIPVRYQQLVAGARVAGPAYPVLCAQGDNLGAHAAMELLRPGEILLLAMPRPEPVALIGELLALQARARGAAGALVDGAIRDVSELAALKLPIWARYVSPKGAKKEAVLGLGVPVEVEGVAVHPGDYLVMDGDGVVVVPAGRAHEVLQKALSRAEAEEALRARIARGELTLDAFGLRERAADALAAARRL